MPDLADEEKDEVWTRLQLKLDAIYNDTHSVSVALLAKCSSDVYEFAQLANRHNIEDRRFRTEIEPSRNHEYLRELNYRLTQYLDKKVDLISRVSLLR